MASELRVNTLKDASGNNSVALSTVAEGSGKEWHYFDGNTSNTIRDSFNLSSVTDQGTGDYLFFYTNNMNSNYYSVAQSCGSGGNRYVVDLVAPESVTTGYHRSFHVTNDNQAVSDVSVTCSQINGDLA
jgi:hypothetical protein